MDGEDMTVKARMLKLLEQHENELISGEAAAAELNCTRAAIWKAVKSLREEGYTIEAGPNKGYVLRGGSRLSEEGIRLYLDHPDVPVKYTENWILQTVQPRRLHFQEKQAMAH